MKQFFLTNGLYIVIVCVFILLCILAPVVKHTQLLTMNNILNILQAASPRMFLALGVGGLILLAGTDLSVGRMVGTSVLAGASRPAQVLDNLQALNNTAFTEEELQKIDRICGL